MESRTEQHGNVEVGIITHEGKEFSALGSIADDGSGRIAAYLGKDGKLTNWNGDVIGTYRLTRYWFTPRSYVSDRMYQVYAFVNGKQYQGRSTGEGMLFKGKLVK